MQRANCPQPEGHSKISASYEVWLSNHIRSEPEGSSRLQTSGTVVDLPRPVPFQSANGGACPSDDTHDYLEVCCIRDCFYICQMPRSTLALLLIGAAYSQ